MAKRTGRPPIPSGYKPLRLWVVCTPQEAEAIKRLTPAQRKARLLDGGIK